MLRWSSAGRHGSNWAQRGQAATARRRGHRGRSPWPQKGQAAAEPHRTRRQMPRGPRSATPDDAQDATALPAARAGPRLGARRTRAARTRNQGPPPGCPACRRSRRPRGWRCSWAREPPSWRRRRSPARGRRRGRRQGPAAWHAASSRSTAATSTWRARGAAPGGYRSGGGSGRFGRLRTSCRDRGPAAATDPAAGA